MSAEVGIIKPDPEIYARHARDFDLDPQAIFFVDDSPANVEGARDAGWQAVLFTDAERLRDDLAALRPAVTGGAGRPDSR